MNGGLALGRMLQVHDVGPMFGMGGFQLLPLYRAIKELGLEHHLTDDERSGLFAADAYARITGKPGVVDATLGPGATNLVTALVESLNAGIPIVAIVGDTHRSHSWKNMTQEARQLDILAPASKLVIRVEDGERIPELVRRAFAVATSGRPGPVVLAVPEDVAHGDVELPEDAFWAAPNTRVIPAHRSRPAGGDVAAAVELLAGAQRPLILAGGGVHLSGAHDALLALSDKHGIPVAHTLSGKGAIPCTHPRSVGLFGRYDRIANDLITDSDCLLIVGCKLGEIATKRYALPLPETPTIHVDVSPGEIGRWKRADVSLWADARLALEDLHAGLLTAGGPSTEREAYTARAEALHTTWRQSTRARYESDERPINMARLMGELNALLPADGILVTDGGFASHWAGLLFDTRRAGRHFVSDRGFASIGYGLPGALGCQLAAPDRQVVGITGDGGFNMTIGGLETAKRVGAPLTLIVVNNAASGYVKALQHAVYGPEAYQSSDLTDIDYARLAEGFGCHGQRVEDPADLATALEAAFAERSVPSVIDVVVTRNPAEMLPGVDSRTQPILAGDRPA